MERRTLGYVDDTLIVYERVAGTLLTKLDLDALDEDTRDTLFRRLGRTLRRLEDGGLRSSTRRATQLDDPSTTPRLGPVPVVIDVDGVGRSWASPDRAASSGCCGACSDHPQYTPADSLALCQGYAPYAARAIAREPTRRGRCGGRRRHMTIDLPAPPQRILLIKPSAIGDVVHTLPVLNLLRRHWPAAAHRVAGDAGVRGPARRAPALETSSASSAAGSRGAWRSPRRRRSCCGFGKWLRDRRFDLVIDLQGLFRSGWMAWQTQAPVRVGFANAREFASLFYTHRVPIEHARAARDRPVPEGARGARAADVAGRVPVRRGRRRPAARRPAAAAGRRSTPCCCPGRTGRRSAGRWSGSRGWSSRCSERFGLEVGRRGRAGRSRSWRRRSPAR